ncbi:MAG: transketolase C-terminal domain-containing protein [Clostridia bacterium]
MKKYTNYEIERYSSLNPRNVVGEICFELANLDEKFVLLYADIGKGIGIDKLKKNTPAACVEVGIAEQNMLGIACGMAQNGINAFAISYAPFITARVLDQIRVYMGYMQSPIKLVGLSAGLVAGDLGATHTCLEDIATMRTIPNLTVVSPCDAFEYVKVFHAVAALSTPCYVRLTGGVTDYRVNFSDYEFEIGKAITLSDGNEVALISNGTIAYETSVACELLRKRGISVRHINMHTIKPLDENCLLALQSFKEIFTVEEHSIFGGLGGAVAEFLASQRNFPRLTRIGVNDQYFHADHAENLRKAAGLDGNSISEKVLSVINE